MDSTCKCSRFLLKDSPPSPVPPLPERTPESFDLATDEGMTMMGRDESITNFMSSPLCTLSNCHLIFNRFGTKHNTGKATGCRNESWEISRMVWPNK